ncbi:hypothetical protein [Streptomyces chumphonensis]|uniref:hypothetical protein n=1 Tax=Streptomyces chumphonensis TaxID=1214925 RepID=UPI003D73DE3F
MSGDMNPWLGAVLTAAALGVVFAARYGPGGGEVTDLLVEGDEPREMACCASCGRDQLSAMHEDGSHTCLTCLKTTAGGQ